MTRHTLPFIAAGLLLAACGSGGQDDVPAGPPPLTAASLGEQQVLGNAEYLATSEYASVDAAWGERLAAQCRVCHALEAGGNHMIGPALHGFFGKQAGSADGYAYSKALQGTDFVWTPRALDAWLAQPAGFLPGNRMTYAGLAKSDDRRAVIAYLLTATE